MNMLKRMKLLNEQKAQLRTNEAVSWHEQYNNSSWIYIEGFPNELIEEDLICVFSLCGKIVNINLVRDKITGKSKGYCFVCYEDQRSTVLAVDHLNGIVIKGPIGCRRAIGVEHVRNYRPPKDHKDFMTERLRADGRRL